MPLCSAGLFSGGSRSQNWHAWWFGALETGVVRTVMLPFMSFLTREKVVGPRRSGRRAVSFKDRVSWA